MDREIPAGQTDSPRMAQTRKLCYKNININLFSDKTVLPDDSSPACAVLRAPQSLQPSPHMITCRLNKTVFYPHTKHFAMHTAHCTLHTAHYTLCIAHCTIQTGHCPSHTVMFAQCIIQTAQCTNHNEPCTYQTHPRSLRHSMSSIFWSGNIRAKILPRCTIRLNSSGSSVKTNLAQFRVVFGNCFFFLRLS